MHKSRTFLLAAGCTLAGALGAGGAAAVAGDRDGFRHHKGFGFSMLHGAVHSEAVVPKGDDGFATVVFDRGRVTAIDGRQLTVAIGTRDDTWKTDTFDVPEGAKVIVWGERDASLSDIDEGDKVAILRSPRKYVVFAAGRRDKDGNR